MPRRRADDELAPSLAQAMRELRDEFRADYNIGENTRFMPQPRGVAAGGSGADYHYRSESRFLRGIERARHYDRNDMVVGQGVNRLCANLLQTGYNLDVQTGDEKLNTELEERFWAWADSADDCDQQGEKTFADFEFLSLRHAVVDGDNLVLLIDDGTMELVEAHRVRTPSRLRKEMVHGIKLDPVSRRRLAYYVSNEEIEPDRMATHGDKFTSYKAREKDGERYVLHVYDPKRYSQTRGVTALAPMGEVAGMHGDVQFATMVKAQVAAAYAILEEYDVAANPPPIGGSMVTGATTTETLSDGTTRTSQGIGPGMRVRGAPGAKLKGFAPNIPNPEFFPHAMMLLTFIAINLDLPVHVLLLDPSKTNFSGWRGAIEQARIRFRQIQQWHIRKFHAPVYRWKVREWASKDPKLAARLAAVGPLAFTHQWHPDAWQYIEPNKDAAADLLQTRNLMLSQRRRAMRLGMQFKPLVREIVEDNAYIIEQAHLKAEELNGKYPGKLNVTWREVACLPTADGVTAVLSTQDDREAAEETTKPAPKSKPSTSED